MSLKMNKSKICVFKAFGIDLIIEMNPKTLIKWMK